MATIKGKWLYKSNISATDAAKFKDTGVVKVNYTHSSIGSCTQIGCYFYASLSRWTLGPGITTYFAIGSEASTSTNIATTDIFIPVWGYRRRILDFGTTAQTISDADLAKIQAIAVPFPEKTNCAWFLKSNFDPAIHYAPTNDNLLGYLKSDMKNDDSPYFTRAEALLEDAANKAIRIGVYADIGAIKYSGTWVVRCKHTPKTLSSNHIDNYSYTYYETPTRVLDLTANTHTLTDETICYLLECAEPVNTLLFTEGCIKEIISHVRALRNITGAQACYQLPQKLATLPELTISVSNMGNWSGMGSTVNFNILYFGYDENDNFTAKPQRLKFGVNYVATVTKTIHPLVGSPIVIETDATKASLSTFSSKIQYTNILDCQDSGQPMPMLSSTNIIYTTSDTATLQLKDT